jgi:hypothetical protein
METIEDYATSKKTELFIVTAMKTSNPTREILLHVKVNSKKGGWLHDVNNRSANDTYSCTINGEVFVCSERLRFSSI